MTRRSQPGTRLTELMCSSDSLHSIEDVDALRGLLQHFFVAIEQSPVATAITDTQGRIEFVNRQFIDVTGYRCDELIGQTPAVIKSGLTPDATYREMWASLRAGRVWKGEILNRKKSGELYWEAETITPVRDARDEIINFIVTKEDITERKQQESQLRLLATAFETGQATLITDANMQIERVNCAFTEITGYTADEVIGKTPRLFKSGRHERAFYTRMWDALLETGHWQGEIWNRNKAGSIYPIWQSITAVRDAKGEVRNFVAVFHDIAERKRIEQELERQATRDHLTGLYNRRALDEATRLAIAHAERHDSPFALVLFDLDHFKAINDTHGHDIGDAILRQVSDTVSACLRATDRFARWGGEEFAILLTHTDAQGASISAERIRHAVASTLFEGLAVTISLGTAHYRPGDTADTLLVRADAALYRAKRGGRNRAETDVKAFS